MNIIDFEVEEIQKLCENTVQNSKIVACTSAGSPLVRVDIGDSNSYRQVTVCLRFPADYPKEPILVEIKSRTLSTKFLDGLATLSEKSAREHLGKTQGLHVLRFIQQYVQDNPLCVCFDEIQDLRRDLGARATPDQLKLKQRHSIVQLTAKGGEYYYKVSAFIPEDYPRQCVQLQQQETNLPAILLRYLNGQSREIARQCVEQPLRLNTKEQRAFQPVPSLYRALKFCLAATFDFHAELCPICDKEVLPKQPSELELDDSKDAYVERVYCGHLFHQGCLKQYLQQPPFPKGGKLCPAKKRHPRSDAKYYLGGASSKGKQPIVTADNGGTCGIRLAHDRWVVNVKLAESRWAQKQARERELQEVVDFLK
ncbi:uncharacterized protein LOC101453300 [Ceratitis capitata]|uniref:(Mediterranean fruit fly) hypothetical protein n=1 Tax=Ceratitis capitata TaxID=7213 RepID=W8C5U6_CERCA|nr:uncharacterized protein LOC101453300 [Ceratitis capitata]CAD6998808.1 unnamed protein product [Ceratitis capitata]